MGTGKVEDFCFGSFFVVQRGFEVCTEHLAVGGEVGGIVVTGCVLKKMGWD